MGSLLRARYRRHHIAGSGRWAKGGGGGGGGGGGVQPPPDSVRLYWRYFGTPGPTGPGHVASDARRCRGAGCENGAGGRDGWAVAGGHGVVPADEDTRRAPRNSRRRLDADRLGGPAGFDSDPCGGLRRPTRKRASDPESWADGATVGGHCLAGSAARPTVRRGPHAQGRTGGRAGGLFVPIKRAVCPTRERLT